MALGEKLRILHVIDTLGIGGAELGLLRIVERTRDAFDHTVVCIRHGGPTASRIEAQGVPLIRLNKPPGSQWHLPLRIARICRRIRPHVVHTRNWGSMDGVIAARLARVPLVLHAEHGFHITDVLGGNRRVNLQRRLLAPLIHRIVAVSDHLRDFLVDEIGIRASRVTVVRDGIDLGRFRPLADRAALRQARGYAADDLVVGTVGRLDPVKNFPALVDAMVPLLQRVPNARLMIVGDGPESERLRRHVEQLGLGARVELLGHREDVPLLLGLMDVFALPSLAEGTCNAILEGMAAELPVVATRVAGNPELVLDGATGFLVPPNDAVALAERIARYAADPELRRRHGAAGREHVARQYTVEQMVAGYTDLYQHERQRRGA